MCTKKPFKSNRFCSFLLKLPFHVWPLVDLWSDNYGARILILDTPDSQSPVWAAHLGRVSAEWRGSGHQWPGPPLSLRVTGHQSQHSLASRKIDLAETRKILETYLYLIYHWKNRSHWKKLQNMACLVSNWTFSLMQSIETCYKGVRSI